MALDIRSALRHLALIAALAVPAPGLAQGPSLAFGDNSANSDAPVEVEADSLAINQSDGTAEFSGNVLILQGTMKLTATRVLVTYAEDQSRVQKLEATGGVVVVSGADAAESDRADYDLDQRSIVMIGNVVIVQGPNTLTSDRMTIDLEAGTARMDGRVRTLLKTGDK
ncbi:lipopolysaccharide transport periplasmic protein LptA [Pseudooceanicola sp.]|uniref:lipopolysaccharide transport periplasmic protein LptA n=1 Tax=Pseudooceanicola sp. TaxID=1914328 RepID=UPI00261D4D57|nr:lipopolysaccharide transport periplasmic protein LptA [Pseudooceanicola sp.]MDF1856658.1 lipopolysaccharide transport periplasmic protein LptA [Pseudooceanicola sp.]